MSAGSAWLRQEFTVRCCRTWGRCLLKGGRLVRVFLGYRRGDAGGYAGRLTDVLLQRLGSRSVFQDVTAISPGEDYTLAIDRALADCDAALVVIGPGWLTAASPEGTRRLFEPGDYVRLELARMLRRDIRVIPVLVGGAALPTAADLPSELQGLARRQAVVLHDETWHQDVDGLVRSLHGEPTVQTKRNRRWLLFGTVALVLLALGAAAWWRWGPSSGQQAGSQQTIAPCTPPAGDGWRSIELSKNPTGTRSRTGGGRLIFKVKDAHWRAHNGEWQVILATSMEADEPGGVYHDDRYYESLIVGQREFKATCFSANPDLVGAWTVGDALIGFDVRCKPVGYIELRIETGGKISVTPDTLKPGAC